MLRYLVKRLLSSLPAIVLGLVGLFAFRLLPSQSVWEERLDLLALEAGSYDEKRIQAEKLTIRSQLGLDLPVFYFSVQSAALPESIPIHFSALQVDWIKKTSLLTGQPDLTIRLADLLRATKFDRWVAQQPSKVLEDVELWLSSEAKQELPEIAAITSELKGASNAGVSYWPAIYWHGKANQFHLWFSQLLAGDLGVSWKNREKVIDVIARAVANTIIFTIPAVILIFVSAYWLVVAMAKLSPRSKHIADQVIYFFDLFPLFGWALLAMVMFASGTVFSWFPSHVSASTLGGGSLWPRSIWPFVLPVVILWVSTLPFVTKHIDNAFRKSADQPFVFMARARGIEERTINRKYRLRYSLLPAVTLFGEYLLAVISGALVVEVLFSIQGVGMLLTQAVNGQDYPVVTGVILLLMVVRMISYLITDLLYYWMDPRIRLTNA